MCLFIYLHQWKLKNNGSKFKIANLIIIFTEEVDQGKIYYQLDDENDFTVTKDEFEFQVSDSNSHTLTENYFHIQWSWLHFESSSYNITETDGVLRVKVSQKITIAS